MGVASAVLFVDFQVDVCAVGGRMVSQEDAVLTRFAAARGAAAEVLRHLRADGGARHAFVRHAFEPGYPELEGVSMVAMERYASGEGAFEIGSEGAAFVEELAPLPGEMVFTKTTISAFASTALDRWLRRRDVGRVAIAGVVTHYAVLATALAANDLGYRVTVLKDCCASASLERHEMALAILAPLAEIMSGADFLDMP